MPVETIYALGESNITVSGGAQLSGINQGDGSHLVGRTITLNNNDWEAVEVFDTEANFQDSDSSQRLEGSQVFDGESYGDDRRVEAEYRLVVEDSEGNQYELLGFNINEPGVTSYSTVEGLAFVDNGSGFPPIGAELTVVSAHEGPSIAYDNLAAPPCFTKGCMIRTPDGERAVETLKVGDQVDTLFNGPQAIRWIGEIRLPAKALRANPKFRPVRIVTGALGQGLPVRDLVVSRQHRMMIASPIAERMFQSPAVLTAAHALCNLPGIDVVSEPEAVVYFHLLFDRHEIVFAEGAPTESLFVGEQLNQAIPAAAFKEILELYPDLKTRVGRPQSALPLLCGKQTKPLVARHAKNGQAVLQNYATV